MSSKIRLIVLVTIGMMIGCNQHRSSTTVNEQPVSVATSLSGIDFFEPERSTESQLKLDSNLVVARRNFEANASEENYIWWGRRLAYLSRYDSAIQIFSAGIVKFPASYRLYRHRGHRYISIRKFDAAIRDFNQAVGLMKDRPIEIEPDGQPNKMNVPLSNTQFNVWYHLGLAYYLNQDFENSSRAYEECMKVSDNDDLICATSDWLYMAYKRLDEKQKAAAVLERITAEMQIIENDSYFERLMMYKGLRSPDQVLTIGSDTADPDLALATQGYGVGNWYLYHQDSVKAKEIFKKVVSGKHFSSFGFIAAEAELFWMEKKN